MRQRLAAGRSTWYKEGCRGNHRHRRRGTKKPRNDRFSSRNHQHTCTIVPFTDCLLTHDARLPLWIDAAVQIILLYVGQN